MTGEIALIEVRQATKRFKRKTGLISGNDGEFTAVYNISFSLRKGEVHGIAGESGCGKTTAGKMVLGLEPPSCGEILFKGENVYKMPRRRQKEMRRKIQMVFQDPYSSLNPRMTAGETVAEPLVIHGLKNGLKEKTVSLLKSVGLPEEYLNRYPHELSGGQRQRIAVARALALSPEVIIADEPVSALDVSVQAQVLNLLKELKTGFNLSYLFISHDFSVMRFLCDRISVMYMGRIVETGQADDIFSNPQHPYTEALLSAVLIADPEIQRSRKKELLKDSGETPRTAAAGCRFRPRCKYAQEICAAKDPALEETATGHSCACHIKPFKKNPSVCAIPAGNAAERRIP